MPIVLTQRSIADDPSPKYRDVEGVIYHYPRVYFKRVLPDDHFVYYRPIKGSSARDAGTYFGFGLLGVPYPDPNDAALRFVDIKGFQRFARPVPVRGSTWVETGSETAPQFQASVRELSTYDYHRLLIAGGVTLGELRALPVVEDLLDGIASPLLAAPIDTFRTAPTIPDGTGYVWQGAALPNLAESAALQERARADHQRVLKVIAAEVGRRGGSWFYNNNVDLYARVGEQRILVEAKSLTDPARAVDRMRYGMGQLFDYRVRYKAQIADAVPVLAFGTAPARNDAWIANILEANGVALVGLMEGNLRPLNARAEGLPILSP